MRKIISFLKEARAELGKVVWPTRRRTVRLSIIVIIVTILFGIFIGVVDYGLSKGVQAVIDATKPKPAGQEQPAQPGQVPPGAVQVPADAQNQSGQQPAQPNPAQPGQ